MVAVGGHPRPTRWLPAATRRPAGARHTPTNPVVANAWLIATAVSLGAFAVVAVDAVRGGEATPASSEVAAAPTTAAATPRPGAPSTGAADGPATTVSVVPAGGATTPAPSTAAGGPSSTVAVTTAADGAPVTTAAPGAGPAAESVAPTANQVTAGPQGGDRPGSGTGGSSGSARADCADAAGDRTTDGLGDVDLLGVQLQRDASGLLVRFDLNATVPPNTAAVGGAPSTSLWQVLLANGDTVLYAFSVTQQGTTWETNLVDFTSSSGDRIGTLAAPTGSTVEALIPADSLGLLPNTFSWWALTSTDRQAPSGSYIGDDCPNGTGDIEAGLALPAEATRSTFSS